MIYNIIEKSNIDRYFNNRLVFIADIFLTLFSSLLSITFVSIVARNDYSLQYVSLWVGGSFVFSTLSFLLLKTSTSVQRYSSVHVVGLLLLAIVIKQILLGLTIVTVHLHLGYSFPHLFSLSSPCHRVL